MITWDMLNIIPVGLTEGQLIKSVNIFGPSDEFTNYFLTLTRNVYIILTTPISRSAFLTKDYIYRGFAYFFNILSLGVLGVVVESNLSCYIPLDPALFFLYAYTRINSHLVLHCQSLCKFTQI